MAEPNTTEENLSDQDVANFSWWLCMLPFLAAIAFFCYQYLHHRSDTHWLLYAVGSLLIGLLFTALVAGGIGGEAATTDGASDSQS